MMIWYQGIYKETSIGFKKKLFMMSNARTKVRIRPVPHYRESLQELLSAAVCISSICSAETPVFQTSNAPLPKSDFNVFFFVCFPLLVGLIYRQWFNVSSLAFALPSNPTSTLPTLSFPYIYKCLSVDPSLTALSISSRCSTVSPVPPTSNVSSLATALLSNPTSTLHKL